MQQIILSVVLLLEGLRYSASLPTTINKDAVQRITGSPALGRGYSITTNSMLASCLNITNHNETEYSNSYNFDYYFTDFTKGEKANRKLLGGKISKSFGYSKAKSLVGASYSMTDSYRVVVTMRLERFFSSVWESGASLTEDASKMLDDEEFISFFMACGPSYVRSLQRAQEVSAVISFKSVDPLETEEFANMLRLYVHGNRGGPGLNGTMGTGFPPLSFDSADIMKTLSIEILGFGLGLNKVGTETLVATSLDEFNEVMEFAFDSMTKNNETESESQTGMVYSMEVIPWADSSEFLKYADVDFNRILSPVPRYYMPNTIAISDEFGERLGCADDLHVADNFGKCCEEYEKVNITLDNGFIKEGCVAKQYMSPIAMKENLETNGEFVAWLGKIIHDKKMALTDVGQCANKLRTYQPNMDYDILHASDMAKYDHAIDNKYTVKELKAAIDPNSDLSLYTMISGEIEEYIEMYYQPCLDVLYGKSLSEDQQIDPKYIMAEPWYKHDACAMPSCLDHTKAWDRVKGGGCVNGLLGRLDESENIPDKNDMFCAKELNLANGGETCKHLPNAVLIGRMDKCREVLPQGRNGRDELIPISISYLIDYFCLPESTGDQGDEAKKNYVDHVWMTCTGGD